MKYFLLLFFISVNIYAEPCNLSSLSSVKKVQAAQDCMIQKLESISTTLENFYDYKKDMKKLLEKVIRNGAHCRKAKLLEQKTLIKECEDLYKLRLQEYADVVLQFNKMQPKIKDLASNQESLKLKNEILKNSESLIIDNYNNQQ